MASEIDQFFNNNTLFDRNLNYSIGDLSQTIDSIFKTAEMTVTYLDFILSSASITGVKVSKPLEWIVKLNKVSLENMKKGDKAGIVEGVAAILPTLRLAGVKTFEDAEKYLKLAEVSKPYLTGKKTLKNVNVTNAATAVSSAGPLAFPKSKTVKNVTDSLGRAVRYKSAKKKVENLLSL